MTQKEINVLYNSAIVVHCVFNQPEKRRDIEEVQGWVAKSLADSEIYTIPIGSSWGTLTTKELFDEYWKDNSKIK